MPINRTRYAEHAHAYCTDDGSGTGSIATFGIKAPSHLSEYYVPLRIAACTSATTRFIVSLRDPIARAYSAFVYKRVGWSAVAGAAGRALPLHFAQAVELEQRGLRGLMNLSEPGLTTVSEIRWLDLYVRLLWHSTGGKYCGPEECAYQRSTETHISRLQEELVVPYFALTVHAPHAPST